MSTDEMVSGAEIGRRLGLSRSRVQQLAQQAGFPPPIGRIGASVVWNWPEIYTWASQNGRLEQQR